MFAMLDLETYNIKNFAEYLNVAGSNDENLLVINYENESNIRLKSNPIVIDFYLLAVKPPLDRRFKVTKLFEDQAKSYAYVDCPHNILEWDIKSYSTGYNILVGADYMNKLAKDYSFAHYNSHEALYLTTSEELVLWDLYKKAYDEFTKESFSKDIILSYVTLILSYTKTFYDRQFENRTSLYNKVVEEFYANLQDYFNHNANLELPSVAYFAQKANLSANYFGDLIKHCTNMSPMEHIHNFILEQAKYELRNTSLSISEISHKLGFNYPNYFARFFKKQIGMSPKDFRAKF